MTWFLTTLQQWLLFTGAVVATGCVAWRLVVAPGAVTDLAGSGGPALASIEGRVTRLARLAGGVLVVAWVLRMVVQVMGFRDPFAPLWDDVSLLLFQTFWGSVWMGQGVVVAVLVAALFAVKPPDGSAPDLDATLSRRPAAWTLAAVAVVSLAATLALSSHAVGADTAPALAVTADAAHALAAGCWIGTLAVILAAGRPPEAPDDPKLFAAQIRRFSPLALTGGIVIVSMGTFLSWTHLPEISALWTTTYGRVLCLKVGLVVVVLTLGFLNWRRGIPVVDTDEGAALVRRQARGEVLVALAVIVVTAILVHSPRP